MLPTNRALLGLANYAFNMPLANRKKIRDVTPFFSLFSFFFSFFLFDLNAIPTASGLTAYAPTSSSGADSPWRRLCFGLNSPIPFFSFVENVTFFKLVQNCGSLQSNAIEQGTLVLSNKLTAQIMRKIVGDKKPINRLSIGKVLSCD